MFGQRGAIKENTKPAKKTSKSKSKPAKDLVISLNETILDIINDSFGGQEKESGKGKANKCKTPKSDFNVRKENASTPKTPGSNKEDADELVSKSSKAKIGRPRKLTAHCSSPILSSKQKTKVASVFKAPQLVKPLKSVPASKVSPLKLSRKAGESIWEQELPGAKPTIPSTSSTVTSTSSGPSCTPSAPTCTVRSCNCLKKCTPAACSCRLNIRNIQTN